MENINSQDGVGHEVEHPVAAQRSISRTRSCGSASTEAAGSRTRYVVILTQADVVFTNLSLNNQKIIK